LSRSFADFAARDGLAAARLAAPALRPEELDLSVNAANIQAVLDTTPEHDLETAQRIEGLLKRG
jgi:hypothetical protein